MPTKHETQSYADDTPLTAEELRSARLLSQSAPNLIATIKKAAQQAKKSRSFERLLDLIPQILKFMLRSFG